MDNLGEDMKKINVLAIMGAPYCGSTLLGYQLGSLTNCMAMGEIYNRAFRGTRYGECATCGSNCEAITDDFVSTLTLWNVYEKYAERFGVTNFVDGSKVPQYFIDLILPNHIDNQRVNIIPVIMYKHPLEKCASYKMHENIFNPDSWYCYHVSALAGTENNENRIILSYKDFAQNNEAYLKYLCELIGEDYDPAIKEYWNFEHHQLGGNNITHLSINAGVMSDFVKKKYGEKNMERETSAYFKKISYREKWKELLTLDEVEAVINCDAAMRLYYEMEDKRLILR